MIKLFLNFQTTSKDMRFAKPNYLKAKPWKWSTKKKSNIMPEENPTPPTPSNPSNHQVQTVVMENGNPYPTGAFTTSVESED